jgi:hypothetical protein
VELEDTAQVIQTVHRELDSCTDLVGDVLGDITQQGSLRRMVLLSLRRLLTLNSFCSAQHIVYDRHAAAEG